MGGGGESVRTDYGEGVGGLEGRVVRSTWFGFGVLLMRLTALL